MIINQPAANTYEFKARGVDYTIIQRGELFEVWCKRGRTSNPPRVMTADEMRAASKTLSNFMAVLTA